MDYKAKYEEALEAMRVIYPNLKGDAKLAVEHAFPELAESEDEKMIKRIKQAITGYHPNRTTEEDSRMLAYLDEVLAEKKQKPVACQDCAEHLKDYISGRGDAENKLLENFGAIVTPENNELRIQARSKSAEWSEEDKEMIMKIISSLRGYICTFGADPQNHEAYIQKEIDWLKSLRPQPKKKTIWHRAKAGTLFPSEALVIGDDGEARLSKVAVNDCWYILVEKLLRGEDEK